MKIAKYFAVFLIGFIVAMVIMGATEPYRHDDAPVYIPVPVVPSPALPPEPVL